MALDMPPPYIKFFSLIWEMARSKSIDTLPEDKLFYKKVLEKMAGRGETTANDLGDAYQMIFPPSFSEFKAIAEEIKELKERLEEELWGWEEILDSSLLMLVLNYLKTSIEDFGSKNNVMFYKDFLYRSLAGDSVAVGILKRYEGYLSEIENLGSRLRRKPRSEEL